MELSAMFLTAAAAGFVIDFFSRNSALVILGALATVLLFGANFLLPESVAFTGELIPLATAALGFTGGAFLGGLAGTAAFDR